MKQKPIPFDSESVQSLLTCAQCGKLSVPFPCEHCGSTEFAKTQTRRLCNPQPPEDWESYGDIRMLHKMQDGEFVLDRHGNPIEIGLGWCNEDGDWGIKPKYYQGELGWVKEGLYRAMVLQPPGDMAYYRTEPVRPAHPIPWRWKPGRIPAMFMPKETARIWVEFGPNRPPERVQDISNDWVWCYQFKRCEGPR